MLFLFAGEMIASQDGLAFRIALLRRHMGMNTIIPYVLWVALLLFLVDFTMRVANKKLHPWFQRSMSELIRLETHPGRLRNCAGIRRRRCSTASISTIAPGEFVCGLRPDRLRQIDDAAVDPGFREAHRRAGC